MEYNYACGIIIMIIILVIIFLMRPKHMHHMMRHSKRHVKMMDENQDMQYEKPTACNPYTSDYYDYEDADCADKDYLFNEQFNRHQPFM